MMLSPEMSHHSAVAGHNIAEAMLLRGHAPPGFPPSPFAAAATMDHQRVSLPITCTLLYMFQKYGMHRA